MKGPILKNRTKKPTQAQRARRARSELIALLVEIEDLTATYNTDRAKIMRRTGLTERRRDITALRRVLADKSKSLRELKA